MAKSPKPKQLKVYRTPIGFHDAYVAAPSMAAALRAWGTDTNLFARGVAEVVDDPKLTAAPLASPGEVIKVARGTAAEHIAALPKAKAKPAAKEAASAPTAERSKPEAAPKPKPRPKRDALDAAEAALAELEGTQRAERRELDRREAELRRERAALERAQAGARAKLEAARDKAERAYREALERWRG